MVETAVVQKTELLQVADTVAREKSIDREQVLEAMEQAIQKAGRSKYGQEHDIRAVIDRRSGEISLARYIEVVDEVVACAREELAALGEPSRLSLLASAALDVVLDGKQKDRERVPQLLLALSEKDFLTPAHFSTAFLEALAILPDITLAAPTAADSGAAAEAQLTYDDMLEN